MRAVWVVACALAAAACAAPSVAPAAAGRDEPPTQSLAETEAMAVIDEILTESQVTPVAGWQVELPPDARLEVDVRLGDSSFGIEWISSQDRASYGGTLPRPDPQGQLRLLGAKGGARERPLILLLDAQSYAFPPPSRQAGPFERSAASEARERLRRDVGDFLEYVRSQ